MNEPDDADDSVGPDDKPLEPQSPSPARVVVCAFVIASVVALGVVLVVSTAKILVPTPEERLAEAHDEENDGAYPLHGLAVDGNTGNVTKLLPIQEPKRSGGKDDDDDDGGDGDSRCAAALSGVTRLPHARLPHSVLLLHGIKTSCDVYPPLVKDYWPDKRGLRFLCPDLLGHGHSPWPKQPLTVARHVDALLAFLNRHTGPGQPLHIVGLSLGALLGLELTARLLTLDRAPLSLTLLAAPYYNSREQAEKAARAHSVWFRHQALSKVACSYVVCRQHWLSRHVLRQWFHKKYPGFPDSILDGSLRHSAAGIKSCVEDVVLNHRPQAAAAALQRAGLPTLLVNGTSDQLCHEQIRVQLARDLAPFALSVDLPEATHEFIISRPSETWSTVANFVRAAMWTASRFTSSARE